ncbi:MAG: polyprenyl synthetase family protein [Bacteriovoracaceae bacterium]|jgi:geranylgeranyl pyrophosphate synthase|nr:polyprenyl synthetase family protein [Bacteriovoracaceae bacterium]
MNNFEEQFKSFINELIQDQELKSILKYSLFPGGKYFRSNLIQEFAKDLNQPENKNLFYLKCAIEVHHTYTLIHDDLPAMDNDDYRRGRFSSHKKYNEASAILAGDALLNLSYEILAHIKSDSLSELITQFSKLCGANGLILGQYLDLQQEKEKDFEDILRIHTLKTSNLFSASLLCANIILDKKIDQKILQNITKNAGIIFQLLDDLSELIDNSISEHEKDINPFLKFNAQDILETLEKLNRHMQDELNYKNLNNLKRFLNAYTLKIINKIDNNKELIKRFLPNLQIKLDL